MAHVPIYQPASTGRVRRLTVRQRLAFVAAAGVPLAFAGSALGAGWSAANASAPASPSGHFADADHSAHLADLLSGRISTAAKPVPAPVLVASPAPAPLPAAPAPRPAPPVQPYVEPAIGAPVFRPVAIAVPPASPTPNAAPPASPAVAVAPSPAPSTPSSPSPEPSRRPEVRTIRDPRPAAEDQPRQATVAEVHDRVPPHRATERERGPRGDQGGRGGHGDQ